MRDFQLHNRGNSVKNAGQSDARICRKSDELLIACCANRTRHSDRSKPVSLVSGVGSVRRSISRFPSHQGGETFRQVRAYGALGHGFFSLFFIPLTHGANKYRKSWPGESGFRYRRDKLARNRCEPVSTRLDVLRCISRCMAWNRVLSSFSLSLSLSLSRLVLLLSFLFTLLFTHPPIFSILSQAFGIDRAAVDSFIVHRVVYLLRLPGFSPWSKVFARTMRHI